MWFKSNENPSSCSRVLVWPYVWRVGCLDIIRPKLSAGGVIWGGEEWHEGNSIWAEWKWVLIYECTYAQRICSKLGQNPSCSVRVVMGSCWHIQGYWCGPSCMYSYYHCYFRLCLVPPHNFSCNFSVSVFASSIVFYHFSSPSLYLPFSLSPYLPSPLRPPLKNCDCLDH